MQFKLDQHGHLSDIKDWHKSWARHMALQDDIVLTDDHWQIIEAVKKIYQLTDDTPPMRLLIKLLRKEINPEIDSRLLYQLFPDNPIRQASKYAGLPKPKHCM